jgi:hypothetical protein
MVRTDHFKYMLSTDDEEAFFDLRADTYEMKNLIAEGSLTCEIQRPRAMLREWSVGVGEKRLPLDEARTQPRKANAKPKKPKK